MTIPTGKGIFAWQIPSCGYNSDPVLFAAAMKAGGFSFVTFKGLQSIYKYGLNQSLLPGHIAALKAVGISPRIYQYINGGSNSNAQAEAAAAVIYCQELGVDGLEIDAEKEYNQLATKEAAKGWALTYMNKLKDLPPSFSVSLCSYRYPSVQPHFPWTQFLTHPRLDFVMPQVYWQQDNRPDAGAIQLVASLAEYEDRGILRENYVPTGHAYCEFGWCSTPGQILGFSEKAKQLGLPGITFWSLQHLGGVPNRKETVFGLDWGDVEPPPPDPEPEPCEYCEKAGIIIGAFGGTLRTEPKVTTDFFPTGTKIKLYPKNTPVTICGEIPLTNGFEWCVVKVQEGDALKGGWMAKNLIAVTP